MIDIDKFICSLIKRYCEIRDIDRSVYKCWLDDVLADQGIIYQDGSLIKIDSKKCEGELKEMLDKKVLANSDSPKFKVGDFVVFDSDTDRIQKITERFYHFESGDCGLIKDIDKDFHLWDITKDARPGDVLVYENEISLVKSTIILCRQDDSSGFGGFTYYCCYDQKHFITDSLYSLREEDACRIHPANEGERALLFQRMHEAGYEWSQSDLKLNKISQRMKSAKAKEEGYSKPLTPFEQRIHEFILDMNNEYLEEPYAADTAKCLGEDLLEIVIKDVDVDKMVEEFWYTKDQLLSSRTRELIEGAYRQGILDTLELIKKG